MDLRAASITGFKWTALASAIGAGLNFLRVLVLARILTPTEFGLAAIATAVLGILQIFADLGVGAAIVQRPQMSPRQLSALFWLTVALSTILAVAFALVVPLIDRFYAQPGLAPLLFLAAGVLPAGALGAIHVLLLQRRLAFGVLAVADVAAAVVNCAGAIAAALLGLRASSIVLALLLSTAVRSGWVVIVERRRFLPTGGWALGDVRGFVGFGLFQIGDRLLRGFATRVDQILIGKLLGATDLGYYNLAYNLVIQPIARLASVLGRVTLPIYAKMQSDKPRLARAFGRVLKSMSIVIIPGMVFLAILPQPIVVLLYGVRWQPSAPLLQLLALAAAFWTIDYPTGTLQVALGQVGLSFAWSGLILALTATGVWLSAAHGIGAVAAAILVTWGVVYIIEYFFIVRRLVGMAPGEYFWEALGLPLALASLAGGIAAIGTSPVPSPTARVVLAGFIFLGCYVWLLRRTRPGQLSELLAMVRTSPVDIVR